MSYNLSEKMEIDIDRLDENWLEQAPLFFEISTKLVKAKEKLAKKSTMLELREASVAQDARDFPEKYGIAKITESTIKEAVKLDKDRVDALEKVSIAKSSVELYQVAVNALEHRKRALESLVTLQGQNYFATPREPTNNREEQKRREDMRKGKIRRGR